MEFSLSVIEANSKGGRPSYTLGRILLFNVSVIYGDFAPGRPEPSADSGGEFVDFAVQLVRAIGLPTGWIESQLRHVIPLWKEWNAQPPAPNRHVWTLAESNAYIASPVDYVPGTKMRFKGVQGSDAKSERDRLLA